MPTTKRRRRHVRDTRLSPQQELELLIGGGGGFKDDSSCHAAWIEHRDELMALMPDSKPWAWVVYEAGGFSPEEGGRITKALARLKN